VKKHKAATANFPDADPMEEHEPMPEWRIALWAQMEDAPVFPTIGILRDPHSGDIVTLGIAMGDGKYALLESRLKTASADRFNNMARHYLRNLYWTSGFFNIHVRSNLTMHQAYISMGGWLRFRNFIDWGPCAGPVSPDARWHEEYVAFAQRCYARHAGCTQACRWCEGYFARGAAGHVDNLGEYV
jgi:hypothetical protein